MTQKVFNSDNFPGAFYTQEIRKAFSQNNRTFKETVKRKKNMLGYPRQTYGAGSGADSEPTRSRLGADFLR